MGNDTDAQAFAALYQEVYPDMYRFALYMLGHVQDAEDVVSDAVVDGYKSFGKLRRKRSFRSWIFKILYAKCKRKLKEYTHKTEELPASLFFNDTMDEDLQVRQAFGHLAEEERLIISMHIFGGYKSRETGRLLGMNSSTVRSKEKRALEKMRLWLEGGANERGEHHE